jgi:hypothetical protein
MDGGEILIIKCSACVECTVERLVNFRPQTYENTTAVYIPNSNVKHYSCHIPYQDLGFHVALHKGYDV